MKLPRRGAAEEDGKNVVATTTVVNFVHDGTEGVHGAFDDVLSGTMYGCMWMEGGMLLISTKCLWPGGGGSSATRFNLMTSWHESERQVAYWA